jgi:carbonic anhydrase
MNPIAPSIALGDMMEIVDFNTRWVYKGSMNEPPCEQFVYWNLIDAIYPI